MRWETITKNDKQYKITNANFEECWNIWIPKEAMHRGRSRGYLLALWYRLIWTDQIMCACQMTWYESVFIFLIIN